VSISAVDTRPFSGLETPREKHIRSSEKAVLLADALVRHGPQRMQASDQRRVHAEYAATWRRHVARRIHWSALYAQLAMRPRIFGGMVPALQRNPALLTWFARWCGKVRPGPVIRSRDRAEQACA
jgi:hypothetical protein